MSTESSLHAATGLGSRGRRRVFGAAVGGAILTACVVWDLNSGGNVPGPSTQPPSGSVLRQYTDQAGWSIRYPAAWHLERSEQFEGLSLVEVTVATFASRPGIEHRVYPGGGNVRAVPSVSSDGRFPADGVALRLVSETGGFGPLAARDTRLPIDLGSFSQSVTPLASPRYNAATGETFGGFLGVPRSRVRQLVLDHQVWTAVLWIGPHAPISSIESARRIISSLSAAPSNPPAPTRTGGGSGAPSVLARAASGGERASWVPGHPS